MQHRCASFPLHVQTVQYSEQISKNGKTFHYTEQFFDFWKTFQLDVMGEAVFSYRSLPHSGKAGDTRETCHPQTFGHRPIYICGEAATTTLNPEP